MSRNTLIYLSVIILVGIMAWFFVKKFRNVSNNPEPNNIVKDEEVKPNNDAWVKLNNGLEIQDVVIGSGREAKNGDTVSAHYVGTLSDGKKFDSSYDRGEPFSFVLGGSMVIKGWDLGLVGMKVGGKRKLIIPPDLGYGSRDVGGGVIPPNSTLYFDVELVAIGAPKNNQ